MLRRFAVAFLAYFISCQGGMARSAAIWIDTDPAIGTFYREVDDAFALLLAFHSLEVRIAGLSTTYGNADLGRTTEIGRDLVRRFGAAAALAKDEVFSGAGSPREIGRRTPASDAFARALQKERITYIALGPLTNLASFLQQHAKLAPRIERVILACGRSPEYRLAFGPNERFRIHDANVSKDPAAVRTVLESRIPITLAPIETSSQLMLDRNDLRRMGGSGLAGEFLYRRSRVWAWFWTGIIREKGGPLFDLLAVVSAAQPELVRTELRYAHLDEGENLIASRQFSPGSRRVQFCTALRPDAKEFVLHRLQLCGLRR